MNADHYAIVVGIDGYVGLQPLQAARQDASRFAEWLLAPDGGAVPAKNLHLILSPEPQATDPFDATPQIKEIARAFRALKVEYGARVGARLYFYFAGHGIGPAFNEVAMLMASAGETTLNDNLGLSSTQQFFHDQALFDEVVFILDCCRERETAECGRLPFSLDKPDNPPPTNDFALLASSYRGKSFEAFDPVRGERRGLLTRALLEALDGAPDALDSQGRVTNESLWSYVEGRVKALAKARGLDQSAERPRGGTAPIVFKPAPAVAATFTLKVTRGPTSGNLGLKVVDPAGATVCGSPPGGGDFQAELPQAGVHQLVEETAAWAMPLLPANIKQGVMDVRLP